MGQHYIFYHPSLRQKFPSLGIERSLQMINRIRHFVRCQIKTEWIVLITLVFTFNMMVTVIPRLLFGRSYRTDLAGGSSSTTSGLLFSGERFRTVPDEEILFSGPSLEATPKTTSPYGCRYWSVVTSVFEPSAAVIKQAQLGSDWCIVIVGDQRSPKRYSVSGSSKVLYLDVAAQKKYGERFPEFFQLLPWNHFGRKNLGYLYAIEHGAEAIWDFDDDNFLNSDHLHIYSDTELIEFHVPAVNNFTTYNPYVQLGAPHFPVWPRGFPLQHIKWKESWNSPLLNMKVWGKQIGVIQSLADHDPDVDAIYRLTMTLPFSFNIPPNSRPIVLPARTFAPLNAQACLFRRSAFWMLLLPTTVHARVADIWRGYAGQRLLWDLNLLVVFSPPKVKQFRNPHNYLADLNSEAPLYEQSEELVEMLRSWSGNAVTLPGRMEQLAIQMYERGYIEIRDVRLTQQWIKALLSVGYAFPVIDSAQASSLSSGTEIPPSAPASSTFCSKDWPPMQLFLPIAPTEESFREFKDRMLWSVDFFWPKDQLNLLLITDAHAANISIFKARLLAAVSKVSVRARVELTNPSTHPQKGHDRQQWLMFWADNFTDSEYIGFVDTDTVFVSRILREDLFEGNRPRVIAIYGQPNNNIWAQMPQSTFLATGIKEKFKAMAYFPVVIKRTHLKNIREHIRLHMNATVFDDAFERFSKGRKYSQFNMMLNILYEHYHDEYYWHISERKVGWAGPFPKGQVTSFADGGIAREELQRPRPRIAMHWTYETFCGLSELLAEQRFHLVMMMGHCFGMEAGPQLRPLYCTGIDVANAINPYEWMFEGDDYSQRDHVLQSHKARRLLMASCPVHRWNQDKLLQLSI